MLLYDLLQNSGKPLHGTVFVAVAELVVEVPVPFCVDPPISVNDAEVPVRVDCELEAIETSVAVSTVL